MHENLAVDWPAIRVRLALVVEVLNLDRAEIAQASSKYGLLAFAHRHRQSLDWLCEGDPRVMIARCAAA